MQKIFSQNKTRIIVLVAIVAVLIAAGFYISKQNSSNRSTDISTDPLTGNPINLDPPTEQEQAAADQRKKDIVGNEQQGTAPKPDGQTKTATVIITDAGQYDGVIEVRSFIPDHYQDGTCTITFRQNAHVITKQAPAYRDATTTICTNPMIKRSEFPAAGNWQVAVAYASAGANGQSETKTIKID